jgi:hypothetical protein
MTVKKRKEDKDKGESKDKDKGESRDRTGQE